MLYVSSHNDYIRRGTNLNVPALLMFSGLEASADNQLVIIDPGLCSFSLSMLVKCLAIPDSTVVSPENLCKFKLMHTYM